MAQEILLKTSWDAVATWGAQREGEGTWEAIKWNLEVAEQLAADPPRKWAQVIQTELFHGVLPFHPGWEGWKGSPGVRENSPSSLSCQSQGKAPCTSLEMQQQRRFPGSSLLRFLPSGSLWPSWGKESPNQLLHSAQATNPSPAFYPWRFQPVQSRAFDPGEVCREWPFRRGTIPTQALWESQNPQMIWVGKSIKGQQIPPPAKGRNIFPNAVVQELWPHPAASPPPVPAPQGRAAAPIPVGPFSQPPVRRTGGDPLASWKRAQRSISKPFSLPTRRRTGAAVVFGSCILLPPAANQGSPGFPQDRSRRKLMLILIPSPSPKDETFVNDVGTKEMTQVCDSPGHSRILCLRQSCSPLDEEQVIPPNIKILLWAQKHLSATLPINYSWICCSEVFIGNTMRVSF